MTRDALPSRELVTQVGRLLEAHSAHQPFSPDPPGPLRATAGVKGLCAECASSNRPTCVSSSRDGKASRVIQTAAARVCRAHLKRQRIYLPDIQAPPSPDRA